MVGPPTQKVVGCGTSSLTVTVTVTATAICAREGDFSGQRLKPSDLRMAVDLGHTFLRSDAPPIASLLTSIHPIVRTSRDIFSIITLIFPSHTLPPRIFACPFHRSQSLFHAQRSNSITSSTTPISAYINNPSIPRLCSQDGQSRRFHPRC